MSVRASKDIIQAPFGITIGFTALQPFQFTMIFLLHSGVPVDVPSITQRRWQLESKHISTEVYGGQLTCERIWTRPYWFNGNEGNMLISVEQLVRPEEASHRKFKSLTRNLSV